MAAREKEIAESKSQRASELSTIKNLRSEQETELLGLERMRDEASKASAENRALLEEIKSAQDGSAKLMADINEARQKSEDRRVAAQQEVSSASYATEMARNLMNVYKQALNTYIQIAGTGIQIPEITDEHRLFIVKDMLSQMTTPWDLESIGITKEEEELLEGEIPDVKDEINELSTLRAEYKKRFEKAPFNGWTVEQLKSKLL